MSRMADLPPCKFAEVIDTAEALLPMEGGAVMDFESEAEATRQAIAEAVDETKSPAVAHRVGSSVQ